LVFTVWVVVLLQASNITAELILKNKMMEFFIQAFTCCKQ